jgi:ketosteroid isomerase-like protein
MSKDIIKEFVKQINNHNTEGIINLMAPDHTFIDSHGQAMKGKEELKKAWDMYFELFPDYVINISGMVAGSDAVAVMGHASGTYKNIRDEKNSFYWRLPAAWKVVVEKDKIKLWQVYCDTLIPTQIMKRNSTPSPPQPQQNNQNNQNQQNSMNQQKPQNPQQPQNQQQQQNSQNRPGPLPQNNQGNINQPPLNKSPKKSEEFYK